MAFKRRQFGKSLNKVEMSITSKRGGSIVVSVPQIGGDGKPLNADAVSTQTLILESTGKNDLKLRGAYHQASPFCDYVPNVATGDTVERPMPLPWAPLSSFEDIENIPQEIRALETKGKIPNYLYSKLNDAGEVVSEARQVGDKWVKMDLNVPTYKQYYNTKGEPYTGVNSKGEANCDGEDEVGHYKIVTSKYAYASLVSVGFFNGHAVDEANNKIKGSEGTYMVEGDMDEKYFLRLNPLRAGGKVSIGSRLKKVFQNPFLGVVTDDQVSKGGYLAKGKFTYTANSVRLAVYNEDGNVVQILDRRAYKLSDFVEKRKRNMSATQEKVEGDTAMAANEVAAEVDNDEELI